LISYINASRIGPLMLIYCSLEGERHGFEQSAKALCAIS
jgi:hypothetical protein